jgi:cytochrome P450
VIEETLRCTTIAPSVLRDTTEDVKLLGYYIPKGTHVLFFSNGPSLLQPAFDIAEGSRSESSRNAKDRFGAWDPTDIDEFAPERWLRTETVEKNGKTVEQEVFNPLAGPLLSFGVGPRACFGRRLAYLELRIAIVLLTWSFELLELDERLNSFYAVDYFALLPSQCYVKLRKVDY